jgi:hypothetical protein
MEGSSKYLRLRTSAVAALVAAGLVLTAMSGSASASRCPNVVICAKSISIGVRNSSKMPIQVEWCPNGHVSSAYQFGTNYDPCSVVTETYNVEPGGRHIFANANPAGLIIQPAYPTGKNSIGAREKILYFYVSNPYVGLPFFRAQGEKISLSAGEERFHKTDTVDVAFKRFHDEDRNGESVKLMRIEIRKWPGVG